MKRQLLTEAVNISKRVVEDILYKCLSGIIEINNKASLEYGKRV